MKKYFRILIAVFVGIGVISISGSVHAMTNKDLAGKIYLRSGPKSENRRIVILFNGKGTGYRQFVAEVDENKNIDESKLTSNEKKDYNNMLSSKNGYNKKQSDDSDFYPVKEGWMKIKHTKSGDKIKLDGQNGPKWCKINGDDPNNFTVDYVIDKDRNIVETYTYQLSPQQYKFQW